MKPSLVLATVVLVAVLIGGNFTALKFALDHTTPLVLTGLRTVVGGVFLVSFALLRGERVPRRLDDLGRILVVSLSISTLSSALLVFGVSRVSAGLASLLASTMPLFTAILSFFILGSVLSRGAVSGLAIGFAGTTVLAAPLLGGGSATIGVLSMGFSVLAWAFGTVFMKWKDFSRVSPVMLVGIQLLMSASVLMPTALFVEGLEFTDWSVGLFVPLAYASVPGLAVTFALLATVVKQATPTQAASTAYLIPVFGVLFGFLLRGELLGWTQLVGGALVVVGVYVLVSTAARSAGYNNPR